MAVRAVWNRVTVGDVVAAFRAIMEVARETLRCRVATVRTAWLVLEHVGSQVTQPEVSDQTQVRIDRRHRRGLEQTRLDSRQDR